MSVEIKIKYKYEMDCDFNGKVIACFRETRKLVYMDGIQIGDATHRDVISLEELKKIVAESEEIYRPKVVDFDAQSL